jgi:hypothetical protein
MESTADIEGVITQLVLPSGATTSAQQSQCASYLVSYASQPGAWATFPAIVAGAAPSAVRFFAANGLYWKVRTDWHSLLPADRERLLGHLWAALEGAAGGVAADVPVLRRQCLALGAATVQTSGALAPLFSRVASLATRVLSGGGGGGGALLLLVCAEALSSVAEMAEELSMSVPPQLRRELQQDAVAAAGGVRDLLLAAATGDSSPASVAAAAAACAAAPRGGGGGGGGGEAPLPAAALASLLRCARVWSSPGKAGAAFVAACLAGDAPLLRAAVDVIAALPAADCSGEAAGLFTAAFEWSRAGCGIQIAEKRRALTAVGTALLLRSPALAAAAGGGAAAAVRHWAEALAAVCSEAEWLCGEGSVARPPELAALPLGGFRFALAAADVDPGGGAPRATVGGVPLGVGCLLADCVLQCAAASPPPHVAVLALEFVDYVEVAARHPFFRGPAHASLVLVVAAQCVDSRAGAGRPDAEAWAAYRSDVCPDALHVAASLLGGPAYVRALLALLPAPGAPGGAHAALRAALPPHVWAPGCPEWARVEAVLHCLAVTQDLELLLREALAGAPGAGGGARGFPLAGGGAGSPGSTGSAGGGWRGGGAVFAPRFEGAPPPPVADVLLALLLRVVSAQPAALVPELVTTALQLLRVAASAVDVESALPGALPLVAADATYWPSGAPPLHTCLRDVVEAVASFCATGLRGGGGGAAPWWRRAAQGGGDALAAAAATAAAAFGGSCGAGGGGGRPGAHFFLSGGDGDGGDGEGEGGEEGEEDGGGGWRAGAERATFTVGSACARTLARLLRSFGGSEANPCAYLWPEKHLLPLVGAWEEASGAGGVLAHRPRAELLRELVGLAMLLGKGAREDALRCALALPVARLQGVLAAAAALPPGAPLPPHAEMILSTELALLGSLLLDLAASEGSKGAPSRSRSASGGSFAGEGEVDGFGGGGWVGGVGGGGGGGGSHPFGGADAAASAPPPPPAEPHPLLWLGEALWPSLDALLPRLSAGAAVGRASAAGALSVALAWTAHAIRCFPPLLPSRLSPSISSAAALYAASRAPQALVVVDWALLSLLPHTDGHASAAAAAAAAAGSGTLAPELAASCGALLAALVGTTYGAAGAAAASGWRGAAMDPPPVPAEFFDMCHAALVVCPSVLCAPLPPGAVPPPFSSLAAVCLALLHAAFRGGDGRCARAGAAFLKDVLSSPAVGGAAVGAVREAAGALGAAVAAGLTATEGDDVSHSAVECLCALLRSVAAAEVVAALGEGVEAAATAAAAALMAATADAAARARLADAAARGEALAERTTLLSLSPAERHAVITGAAAGLHGGRTPPNKLRALLKVFSEVCRSKEEKLALIGYLM